MKPQKLNELHHELLGWHVKHHYIEKSTNLVGLLNFCTTYMHKGRYSFLRMVNILKTMDPGSRNTIPISVRKDINWSIIFMHDYNGKYIIPNEIWVCPDNEFIIEACLLGSGVWYRGQFSIFQFVVYIRHSA